ncbi:histidine phosphatase family protein, partial [Streptomyces sp. CAI-78]|nr:histidine phosphatase family protein [Streptomyces sp. CAI-78]
VTHAFLAAWLVRDALDAPAWRWIGLNHANTGLTVLRYTPGRPAALMLFNDLGHLPEELRWTGFPPELRL